MRSALELVSSVVRFVVLELEHNSRHKNLIDAHQMHLQFSYRSKGCCGECEMSRDVREHQINVEFKFLGKFLYPFLIMGRLWDQINIFIIFLTTFHITTTVHQNTK